MHSKFLVGAALFVALTGCPGSVSGTVSGISLGVADTLFYVEKDTAGKTIAFDVILADKGSVCTTLKANRLPKSSTSITLGLFRLAEDLTFLAPDIGDFTVIDSTPTKAGNWAIASFSHLDANCTNTLSKSASSGKSGLVKVTGVNAANNGSIAGTFDVSFGSDRVTGSFSGAYCDLASVPNNPSCE
jgi:hypothetical protein